LRRGTGGLGTAPAKARPKLVPPAAAASTAPGGSLAGTEGFGDRK
jgi:hypothetical protein